MKLIRAIGFGDFDWSDHTLVLRLFSLMWKTFEGFNKDLYAVWRKHLGGEPQWGISDFQMVETLLRRVPLSLHQRTMDKLFTVDSLQTERVRFPAVTLLRMLHNLRDMASHAPGDIKQVIKSRLVQLAADISGGAAMSSHWLYISVECSPQG